MDISILTEQLQKNIEQFDHCQSFFKEQLNHLNTQIWQCEPDQEQTLLSQYMDTAEAWFECCELHGHEPELKQSLLQTHYFLMFIATDPTRSESARYFASDQIPNMLNRIKAYLTVNEPLSRQYDSLKYEWSITALRYLPV